MGTSSESSQGMDTADVLNTPGYVVAEGGRQAGHVSRRSDKETGLLRCVD